MIRLLVLMFTLLLVIPAFGQSYQANWQYQMALHQASDGQIVISYSKQTVDSPGSDNTNSSGLLPLMSADERMYVNDVLMSGEQTNQGRIYQSTLNYFQYLNKNIPPEITLPESTFNKRFPSPSQNQYYPMPEGN